ncbi:MAG: arylsulfatase [Bacteroidota bacterium]
MKKQLLLVLTLAGALSACQSDSAKTSDPTRPNIIYILADDLGYGDISAFNENSKINTKHVDQLVAQGIGFSDAHSGSAVCTPTRYGVLTGRYSWRSSLKSGVTWTLSPHLIDPNRLTVGKLLQEAGYHTACIGKWHLGFDWKMISEKQADYAAPIQNGPNTMGFDYFFGIKASLDIPPYFYIENDRITASTIDTIDAWDMTGMEMWRKGAIGDDFKHIEVLPKLTEKATAYINERAETKQPFFLYFPLPAPHTPILPTDRFREMSNTNAYGDFVLMVDDVVGQIMQALDNNKLTNNTFIVFTSDNGCSPRADFAQLDSLGHHPNYRFRGHKADIYEGGHHVPFAARWPAMVPAGQRSEQTICLTDFLRTCAAITRSKLPPNAAEDSYDLLPLLRGEANEEPLREATVHHSVNGSFAIRQGDWKLIFCPGSGGWSYPRPEQTKELDLPAVQLYNLKKDIGETENLAEAHPEKVAQLTQLMQRYVDEGRSTPGAPQSNEGTTVFQRNTD